jgi:hypothetical protein
MRIQMPGCIMFSRGPRSYCKVCAAAVERTIK